MPKVNCAVIGCSNSTYRLKKWKTLLCDQHAPATKNDCVFAAPCKLFCFPSTLRNSRGEVNGSSCYVERSQERRSGSHVTVVVFVQYILSTKSQQLHILTQKKIWDTKTTQDLSQGGLCASTRFYKKIYLNHLLPNTLTIQ